MILKNTTLALEKILVTIDWRVNHSETYQINNSPTSISLAQAATVAKPLNEQSTERDFHERGYQATI